MELSAREYHGSPVMALKETIDNHFNTNGTTSSFSSFKMSSSRLTSVSVDIHDAPPGVDIPDGLDNATNHSADSNHVTGGQSNGVCLPMSDHNNHVSTSPHVGSPHNEAVAGSSVLEAQNGTSSPPAEAQNHATASTSHEVMYMLFFAKKKIHLCP